MEKYKKGCPKRERVLKTKPGWHKENQVKKIQVLMTVVLIVLSISVVAGLLLAWFNLHPILIEPTETFSSLGESASLKREISSVELEESSALLLVNQHTPLPQDYQPQLKEYQGFQVDDQILPSLEKMIQAASENGCELTLVKGYISVQEQDVLYEEKVKELIRDQGYTRVRAEEEAQSFVERGGRNEYQTGLAVAFGVESGTDFSQTREYQWLSSYSVNYGFILRFPKNKEDITGKEFDSGCFRYVGEEHAKRMRSMGMCLEEYTEYLSSQP